MLRPLAAALHGAGKTLSLCGNELGVGFLRRPFLRGYLDAGVDRLVQMGTYGINHWQNRSEGIRKRDELSAGLVREFGASAIGLGVVTTLHYKQDVESLRGWLSQPYMRNASLEIDGVIDVYYLQGSSAMDPVQGGGDSPPPDWWAALKTDE